jgi:quinol monooxygenase YgiN
MSTRFGLVVRFTARDLDAARGFDELVRRTLTGIQDHEPGTLAYVVHSVPEEPLVRVFYELYADRDAFEAHEQQPHTKVFLEERHRYLAATEVVFLNAEFGKGLAQS